MQLPSRHTHAVDYISLNALPFEDLTSTKQRTCSHQLPVDLMQNRKLHTTGKMHSISTRIANAAWHWQAWEAGCIRLAWEIALESAFVVLPVKLAREGCGI
jgi:hypothetical protein